MHMNLDGLQLAFLSMVTSLCDSTKSIYTK